jgi:hypothetical protein
VDLVVGRSVHLSTITNHILGDTNAESCVTLVRRWLANRFVDSRQLYSALIQEVLRAWANREVTIMLDGCFIRHKALQILRMSLSHCYRALPLASVRRAAPSGELRGGTLPPLGQGALHQLGAARPSHLVAEGIVHALPDDV